MKKKRQEQIQAWFGPREPQHDVRALAGGCYLCSASEIYCSLSRRVYCHIMQGGAFDLSDQLHLLAGTVVSVCTCKHLQGAVRSDACLTRFVRNLPKHSRQRHQQACKHMGQEGLLTMADLNYSSVACTFPSTARPLMCVLYTKLWQHWHSAAISNNYLPKKGNADMVPVAVHAANGSRSNARCMLCSKNRTCRQQHEHQS